MQVFNASAGTQRTLIKLALVLATIYFTAFVFFLDFFPPPDANLSADQAATLYTHSNLKFRIGVALMIVSGGFYLPWSMAIAIQMARIEKDKSIWAMMQALSSSAGTWIFALPPLLWGAAAYNVHRDPALTLMMHELAWLTFITAASFFPFQLISVAIVSLSKNNVDPDTAFPRWLGWLSLFAGMIASEGFIAQVFNFGPFSWNGIFPFYLPTAFFGAWMISMTVMMFRAIRRQELAG